MYSWQVRLLTLIMLLSAPALIIGALAFTIFVGTKVARDVAIATYSGQIQLCAIFAGLAPIIFVFFQNIKPSREQMWAATVFAAAQIAYSLAGIAFSFTNMLSERFDFPSVAMPFLPPALAATMLLFYLAAVTGHPKRLLNWIFKTPE